jgi:hypothetical protein
MNVFAMAASRPIRKPYITAVGRKRVEEFA